MASTTPSNTDDKPPKPIVTIPKSVIRNGVEKWPVIVESLHTCANMSRKQRLEVFVGEKLSDLRMTLRKRFNRDYIPPSFYFDYYDDDVGDYVGIPYFMEKEYPAREFSGKRLSLIPTERKEPPVNAEMLEKVEKSSGTEVPTAPPAVAAAAAATSATMSTVTITPSPVQQGLLEVTMVDAQPPVPTTPRQPTIQQNSPRSGSKPMPVKRPPLKVAAPPKKGSQKKTAPQQEKTTPPRDAAAAADVTADHATAAAAAAASISADTSGNKKQDPPKKKQQKVKNWKQKGKYRHRHDDMHNMHHLELANSVNVEEQYDARVQAWNKQAKERKMSANKNKENKGGAQRPRTRAESISTGTARTSGSGGYKDSCSGLLNKHIRFAHDDDHIAT